MPDPDEISGQVTEGGVPVEDAVVAALRQEDAVDLSQAQATEIEALAKLTDANGEYIFEEEELFGDVQNYHVVAHKDAGNQRRGQQNYPYVEGVGSTIPDSVVDSFEDENLDNYLNSSEFSTVTTRAFDGTVSVTSSTESHDNMRWGSQTIDLGDTATVSVRLWTGSTNRAGPTLVDSAGNGYGLYMDNNAGEFSLAKVAEDSLGVTIEKPSATIPSNEWIKAELSFDGVDTYAAEIFNEAGASLGTAQGVNTDHTPDRHGLHQFDSGAEMDLLEKTL